MEFYAQEMRFEEAGEIRDRIQRISRSQIKSEIDFASNENYDIFVVKNTQKRAVVIRVFMRNGKIISSSHNFIHVDDSFTTQELYFRTILNFYKDEKPPIIAPILIAQEIDSVDLLQTHLSKIFSKKASISMPIKGKRKDLIELAVLNANELLKKDKNVTSHKIQEDIQELCKLQKTPYRVEVFDNSHISGQAVVGAMIVYDDSSFDKKSYRTYHLEAKDEYGQMREVLSRRVAGFCKESPPDLWLLDGGATLLKLALEILNSNGIFLDVLAISKEKIDAKTHRAKGKANDIIYTKDEVFRLKNSDKRLQWVQNLRDEAHRSAITFHKKTKLKLDKESQLLSLHGISQAKIVKLLKHFGTFEELKNVSVGEISTVLNTKDANIIKKYYT